MMDIHLATKQYVNVTQRMVKLREFAVELLLSNMWDGKCNLDICLNMLDALDMAFLMLRSNDITYLYSALVLLSLKWYVYISALHCLQISYERHSIMTCYEGDFLNLLIHPMDPWPNIKKPTS